MTPFYTPSFGTINPQAASRIDAAGINVPVPVDIFRSAGVQYQPSDSRITAEELHGPMANRMREMMIYCSLALGILTLGMLIAGIVGYFHVPAGAKVAIHFSFPGDPNGWTTPGLAFFVLPAISTLLLALLWVISVQELRNPDLDGKVFVPMSLAVTDVLLLIGQIVIVFRALTHST